MAICLLLALAVSGSVHTHVRAPTRSAVSMGPIRAVKRALGIQKQNFLEAKVHRAARKRAPSSRMAIDQPAPRELTRFRPMLPPSLRVCAAVL